MDFGRGGYARGRDAYARGRGGYARGRGGFKRESGQSSRGGGSHQYGNPLGGERQRFKGEDSNGPHRGGRSHRPYEQRPTGYKKLEEMVQNDAPRDIVIRLSSDRSGLEQLLREDGRKMDNGMIQMLLQVFGKMSESDGPNQALVHILQLVLKYEFQTKIISFIYGLLTETKGRQSRAVMHIQNCLKLLSKLLTVLPQSSQKQVKMTMVIIDVVVGGLGNLVNDVHPQIAEMKVALEALEEKDRVQKARREPAGMHEDDMVPPNNFRDIPVFPQLRDIHGGTEIFIRANLIDRAYRDTDHYLDVQYRLLREDFVRPLREGIAEKMHYDDNNRKGNKFFQNVKVYNDVRIEFIVPTQKGIVHRLHFSTDALKNVRWKNTKRLLYGNLLCLSSDHFKNHVLFAVVADRKPEELAYGYVTVQFVEEEDDVNDNTDDEILDVLDDEDLLGIGEVQAPRLARRAQNKKIDMKTTYTMVETEAYFEAYRHVLAGLKETRRIPLDRYLVNCSEMMHAPEYIRPSVAGGHVHYDLSCVVDEETAASVKSVQILGKSSWPTADELRLDSSQAAALQLALTNELAIIQGPPGTGKTYVGLEIMKVLIENKSKWFTPRDARGALDKNSPILVVCYTNHALDQFLEGIASFCSKEQTIVRVGGRCKNEVTKQFSLAEVRRKQRTTHKDTDNSSTRKAIWELNNSLRGIEHQLHSNCAMLEASLHCVQKLSELEDVIPLHLFQQLQRGQDNFWSSASQNDSILQWLGLDESPEIDYAQAAGELPEFTVAMLLSMAYSLDQIGEAYYATGIVDDINALSQWIRANTQEEHSKQAPQEQDYSQALAQLPQVTTTLLIGMGYTQEQIGRAAHFSGKQDIFDLVGWIQDNKPTEGATGNTRTGTTQSAVDSDEDDEIDEEAELMQQQRLLEIDDDVYSPAKASNRKPHDNAREVKQIMKKMAAITFEEIGGRVQTHDEGGWQKTRSEKKRTKKKMRNELGKTSVMAPFEEKSVMNIYDLKIEDRWRLYRAWVDRWRDKYRTACDRHEGEFNRVASRLQELRREEDTRILHSADVVAVTTTGAAKYRDMIYRLNTKIVVVEEAAEVLEAHIVTAMPETTKHLILIGDHQQLKPSPTVYELARKYNLDTSLFERMMKTVPHVTLQLQHRMIPEIADLLRPNIYENLKDHLSVHGREGITGIQKPLFFVSHEIPEESVLDGRSKKNQFEAEYLVRLCLYLMMQGYKPEQITVLVMYTGQLFAFRNFMKSQACRGVRVTAVDNFQGEENDVILLSLVRSNDEGKIGFLSIENRICVALSRARNALYCIGNMELLRSKSSMWRKIVAHLKSKGNIGEALMLQCKHHQDKTTPAKCPADFDKVPEGGCGQPCETRLDCGHVCERPCHPDDHSKYLCRKPCDKILCEHGHRCKKKCHEPCGRCCTPVTKVIPSCGHRQKVACYVDPELYSCKFKDKVELPCGHEAEVACHERRNARLPICREKCSVILSCDDTCGGSCHECSQGRLHVPCSTKCPRILVCGHECGSACSKYCPPCNRACKIRCEHSKCTKTCGQPCTLCREPCEWKCVHHKCTMLCSEPCNRLPCNKPCTKKIKRCGHPCIGLCGETCPTLCRICDKKKVTEVFFGDEDDDDARFVQLEDCLHVFTYESLDHWMAQEEQDGAIKMKECPRCKTPIFRSRRYGNIINGILNSVNEVKQMTYGTQAAIENTRKLLIELLTRKRKRLEAMFPNELAMIDSSLQKGHSQYSLSVVESKIRHLERLSKRKEQVWKLQRDYQSYESHTTKLSKATTQAIQNAAAWVMLSRTRITEQENESFEMETERISKMLQFANIYKKFIDAYSIPSSRPARLSNALKVLEQFLFDDGGRYTAMRKRNVEKWFEDVKSMAPELYSNLGITEQEKKMICAAMDFGSKGHWYKCPKGHIYSIGECGGATETSKCPECKADIGGTGHRLLESNRIATEMDGATRPAYDPLNFDIPEHLLRFE